MTVLPDQRRAFLNHISPRGQHSSLVSHWLSVPGRNSGNDFQVPENASGLFLVYFIFVSSCCSWTSRGPGFKSSWGRKFYIFYFWVLPALIVMKEFYRELLGLILMCNNFVTCKTILDPIDPCNLGSSWSL